MTDQELLYLEVKKINNEEIKRFVTEALKKVDRQFWLIPASSTGKYHPKQSNGKGGLVRHILAALYFAHEFFYNYPVTEDQKDVVVGALLLHDIGKSMNEPHDIVAATNLRRLANKYITDNIADLISCVRWHMGPWSTGSTMCHIDERGGKEWPQDFTMLEQIVHLSDYAASRKRVNLTKLGEL
jgi:hypothetical protein